MTEIEPKTVLHIAPTPFFSDRGCHIRISGLIRAMNRLGYQNLLATYHHGRDLEDIPASRIGAIRSYNSVVAGPHPLKYWADTKLVCLVISICKKHSPDILHAHLHEGVLIAWLCKWLLFRPKLKIIADLQGSLSGELEVYGYFDRFRFLKPIFILLERLILNLADHIVVSSESLKNKLITDFNTSETRKTVVADGVDMRMFENQTADQDDSVKTVVYTGSLLQSKGLDFLQQFVTRICRRRQDVRLLLAGYPENDMREFIAQHGLTDRCLLPGKVSYEQLPELLYTATVAIDPKNTKAGEASGKILNYMAASLPVVCFDTENNRRYLGDSPEQLCENSLDQFITKVEYFLDHPRACSEIGHNNARRVIDNYTWDSSSRILDVVARKIMSG